MAVKEEAVVEKVISELTQLRGRLSTEEKAVLDALVIGPDAEVVAHALTIDTVGRVIERVTVIDEEYRLIE
jgi:hypothetical protein